VTERSIRVAGGPDAPAVAWLHLASYRASYRGLLPAGFLAGLDIGERERRWRDSLRDPARTTFLVEEGRAVVAFAEIGPCRDADAAPGTGELMALHVAESHWRQGIGGTAHGRAVDALLAQGFENAALWVLRGNVRACAFYEAAGGTPDGHERHRTIRGTHVSELRCKLELGR
jgi:RimJ/RimL family protein N-acetyltransferase